VAKQYASAKEHHAHHWQPKEQADEHDGTPCQYGDNACRRGGLGRGLFIVWHI
jgi:hypothetical protein